MTSSSDLGDGSDLNSLIKRSYAISNPSDAQAVYSDWAKNYNAQLLDPTVDYQNPTLVAEAAVKHLRSLETLQVLDAGCGTGLAGVKLMDVVQKQSQSKTTITLDGCDLTPAMLDVAAETKIFRNLMQVDLNKPLSEAGVIDSSYDLIICAGTLTEGHVGPNALSSFVSATRHDGIISATVLDRVWESGGFRAKVDELVQDGRIEVLESKPHTFWKGASGMTRVLVLRAKKKGGQ